MENWWEDGFAESNIKQESTRIKSEILDGSLYGKKIDKENIDELIVAAYYFGKYEQYYLHFGKKEP